MMPSRRVGDDAGGFFDYQKAFFPMDDFKRDFFGLCDFQRVCDEIYRDFLVSFEDVVFFQSFTVHLYVSRLYQKLYKGARAVGDFRADERVEPHSPARIYEPLPGYGIVFHSNILQIIRPRRKNF